MMMLIRLELLALWRNQAAIVSGLSTFLLCALVMPLALGPEPELLARVGGAVLWCGVLFASLLNAERVLTDSAQEGVLEQWRIATMPLLMLVGIRCLVFWLVTCLPIIAMMPLAFLWLAQPMTFLPIAWLSVAAGTLALVLLSTLGSALTLGLKKSLALVVLLVLPLAIPVLIFGAGSLLALQQGASPAAPTLLLAAFTMLLLVVCPPLIALTLRHAPQNNS